MATVTSSTFTVIVNKSAYIDTSTIKVVRGTTDLIAVNSNPTTGQFSFSITSCTGCSAEKADVDTVGIVSATSDIGTVEISINAENVKTYTKQITVAKIKQGSRGPQGVAGADGKPGKDGTSTYTWIKYADDVNGNGLSNDPTGKSYIGFAYNKDTATESNNASDYIWAKIQGEKGDTGVQGPKGADGTTTYTWIKYSDYKDGTDLYDTPTSNTLYIGIATNKTTATESSNETDYVWSRFKGDKGEKGEAGKDGTSINILGSLSSTSQLPATGYSGDCYIIGGDLYVWSATTNAWENCGQIKGEPGDSAYFHIKYSDDMRTFTDNGGEEVGIYIGILTDGNREDSMNFNDYKWSRFRGEQGVTGEKGQSLTKSTPQWYASTSNTTQTGGSWVESMPTIDSSHYLWLRYKLDWANPTATTYTTPTLEQVTESVKNVSAKQSKLEQDLNGFKTTVSNTYATQSTTNSMMSQIQQNADNISTKVNVNGVISSINQSSETIAINANKINLNGYVSNDNANWSIDNEGNIRAENLNVEGDLSADTITCNTLNSPKYPGTLDGDIELFVNSSSGNDDAELDDNAVYKTVQGVLNALPKFLNGRTAHITMQTNSTEDVYLKGFVGGVVKIYMNGNTLYGTIRTYVCSAAVHIYGGTKDNNEGATGIIHPNVGLAFATRSTSVGFESTQYGALYKVKVFAPDTNPSSISSTEKVCVASQAGTGSVYCKNVQIVNAVVGFRCNNHGSMHINSSSGIASKYGFQSVTGGMMSLANNSQAGGSTSATNKSSGGQIWYDSSKVTFASGDQTTESGSAPTVSTTKTMTIKSSYGDTYRSSVYNNWKKDGTCRQGDYGYGDCSGLWFFGSAFSELKGCTISKVQITISRQSGGNYSAVGLVVRTHNYSSRPSGAPTLSSSSYGTLSLETGAKGTLTITNSDVLNGIKNGTVKGFGIRTTYDSAHYAVCSGSVTVKITYTE